MRRFFLLATFMISFCIGFAQTITSYDSITLQSNTLNKSTDVNIITPAGYDVKQKYPVLYLLHGYDGNYRNWITKVPALLQYATTYNMIIVCPDGRNSWYVDQPATYYNSYETFISSELVSIIDKKYSTYAVPQKRAITGLSMGGHGSLTLAVKHPDIFGAAGSMSGAVDMLALKGRYNLAAIAGDTAVTHFNWKNHSALELLDSTTARKLHMIIDCGVEDIFIDHNRALHQKLTAQKVNHDYIERAGGHNWYYWENALPYQLLFFKRYFER